MMKWILGKNGWVIALLPFVLILAATYVFVEGRGDRLDTARRDAERVAERRAGMLADEVGNVVSRHIGALTAAKLKFTPVEDSVSESTFTAAVDTVIGQLGGITAISVVYPGSSEVARGSGAALGRFGLDPFTDSAAAAPLQRALATQQASATRVLEVPIGRRVIIFDPVVRADSTAVIAVLAAELDPSILLRSALSATPPDSLRGVPFYGLYGPMGERIAPSSPAPADWPTVDRTIRVADTDWTLRLAYPPISPGVFRAEQLAGWVGGIALGLLISIVLLLLRRTVAFQRDEISRRKAAEDAARTSAAEARSRAAEARELAAQLESAQRAAQRLSTSLDPDDVVELFLGGVAEILDADVASLYTFAEEGEVLVGRRRMVFREVGPATERLKTEDIRQVRAPAALLPGFAEVVATGEPYLVERGPNEFRHLGAQTGAEPNASLTLPLMVGGHMVGVASWEVFSGVRTFDSATVAFAQALAAPAAAALRTAELFTSLEAARGRAAQEALRFGTVLDQMADGVVVVDSVGHVERTNKAAEELLGEKLGKLPLEEWPAYLRATTIDGRPFQSQDFPLARALRGERVVRANFIARPPGAAERYLSASAGPIRTRSGDPTGAAIIFRDVTDEHQYAEMLRHTNRELRQQAEVLEQVNQQLREATKAKDQFLAVMSHELRTPINAIMGYSDLLDLGVKGPLNNEQKTMITRVRDTSRHLLGLINEILDLAKIGAGQIDLMMVELDVGQVVGRAAEQVMPLAAGKGLSLNVREEVEGTVTVVADETRLAQIIINLLSNAVKFTQRGSVDVTTRRTDGQIEIRVRDTGPGIPEDQRERIFDEFYQVDSGLARNTGGTGLGLAIARRFARLMGGDIIVESDVGNGSEFIVTLPLVSTSDGYAARAGLPCVVMLGRSEALLHEAEASLGSQVRLCGTTDPAHLPSLAHQERPLLVVLDAGAADLGAWRALAALQADPTTANARTLVIAGPEDDPSLAVDLGTFTTMTKPLAVRRVVDVVGRAVNGAQHAVVLVADDDPDVRQILTEALAASGVAVETAASGLQALRTMSAVPPHVALLDLLTPEVAGPELLAHMRANPRLADTAVVMLAARELSAEDMSALQRSIEAVVKAPTATLRSIPELVLDACMRAAGEQAMEHSF